jgi:uncharacterized membrane protein
VDPTSVTTARSEGGGPSAGPVATGRPEDWPAGGLRLPGVWGALLLAWLSFTPSLLPRGPITQGIVGGISAAIGYGLGVLAASVWRAFADRESRPGGVTTWRWTAVAAVAGTLVAVIAGRVTQRRVLELMDGEPGPVWRTVLTPLLAVGVLGRPDRCGEVDPAEHTPPHRPPRPSRRTSCRADVRAGCW